MSGGPLAGAARLVVVVGASGAGKDSLLRAWRDDLPDGEWVHLARRSITRPAHPGSEAHEPLSDKAFEAARAAGAFAFDWAAHGLRYGIRHAELAPLARGGWVVMNGSRGHLAVLRRTAPAARVVEVQAPAALRRQRLAGRAREPGEALAARLARDAPPMAADLVIVNDRSLAEAVAQLVQWWRTLRATQTA